MKASDLRKIISAVEDLPTLPRTVIRIMELVNNPGSSARDLAGVISDDQVLTARLLRLVNSSFYGFPQRITTVTGAIVLLGFESIRSLLLTTSIFDLFDNNNAKMSIKPEQLWDHSLGCAVGSKVIGNYVNYENVEELFVCGLLHDIGKIVEILFLQDSFSRACTGAEQKKTLLLEAENEILGFNHSEVGRILAERWNLPPKLTSAIAHHHEPEEAESFFQEASIVHLADIICRGMELGSGGDSKIPGLNMNAWEFLGIELQGLDAIIEEIDAEFAGIKKCFDAPA
jgi:putative nucleotidyltransferase with HDIG domain